ncbi:MAG: hypothetical protein JJU24_19480 [Natronohydrobacter sp.]|nr:hypothetical protein [Natronohydrobacter sp.]
MTLLIKTPADLEAARAAQERAAAQAEARAYLARTDWLVVRQAETGTAIPEAVTRTRAEARKLLGS